MSEPAAPRISEDDKQRLLMQPDLARVHGFLKERSDIPVLEVAKYLYTILSQIPLSRRLRDQYELWLHFASTANATNLDAAYAELAGVEPSARPDADWMRLGIQFLMIENGDVAKSLLKEYPEIPREAVRVAAEDALSNATDLETERLRERLDVLRHWDEMTLVWAVGEGQEAERRLEEDPTVENLRASAECIRDVLAHPGLLKMPLAARSPLLTRSAELHYSIFLNVYDPAALDRAIEDARTVRDTGLGDVLDIFTSALVDRYESRGRPEDLDEVIAILEPTAHDRNRDTAPLITTLANALRYRGVLRGGPRDIDRAVALYEWLIGLPQQNDATRDIRLMNLASGLITRYDRTSNLRDLDRGIGIMRDLVGRMSDRNPGKTTLYNNLGKALLQRLQQGDLESAQWALSQSVNLLPAGSPELPRNLTNAGIGWLAAYNKTAIPEMVDAAIDCLLQASERLAPGQGEVARTLDNLSSALLGKFQLTEHVDDLNQALRFAELAASEAMPGSPFRLSAEFRHAAALQARGDLLGSPDDLERAAALRRVAIAHAIVEMPLLALEHGLAWGTAAYRRKDWAQAAEALSLAMDAQNQVFRSQPQIEFKEVRLRRVQGIGAMAARALIYSGDVDRAVTYLERGRAALVAEAVGTTALDSGGKHVGSHPDCPVVYLETFDQGFALVVSPDASLVIELPGLNEFVINEWLRQNLSNRIVDPPRFAAALDEICRQLWDIAVTPLLNALAPWQKATLIPGGLLGLLPLHAAWREDSSRPTGRFYASDAICFRYAPSAAVLSREPAANPQSLLCVDEPLPVDAGPLPFSAEEVAAASEHFARSEILKGLQATRAATLDRIPHYAAMHLSCHGFASLQNPRRNGFAMANGEFLTLDDLVKLRLDTVALAFLSACDAGQIGSQLPDEAIGLPSGMLQSGARGVISPLWPVTSWSTVLLIARFYELWPCGGLDAPEALRQAQAWLRDTSNGEKALHFKERPRLYHYLLSREPECREQQAIYFWAPFYYSGV